MGEWFWLCRALGALLGFRLALWLRPFSQIKRFLDGVKPRRAQRETPSALIPALIPARIGRAIRRASRAVPRSTCLVQALAAQWLLRRENQVSQLHVGVIKQNGGLSAHAWVECDGATVVGGEGLERFTPILRWESGSQPDIR